MPRIFDNIEQSLLPALQETLGLSECSYVSVGHFNLRGWKQFDSYIEQWAAVVVVSGPRRTRIGFRRPGF